jgi:hypothetical protein
LRKDEANGIVNEGIYGKKRRRNDGGEDDGDDETEERETKAEEESCHTWEDAGHLGRAYCLEEKGWGWVHQGLHCWCLTIRTS